MKQTKKKCLCESLIEAYKKIKTRHDDTVIRKTARIALGPSIIRVFKPGTRDDIVHVLKYIRITDMKGALKSESGFKKWFIKKSEKVCRVLRPRKGIRMKKGSKRWAHSTKITSLYLRDLLCQAGRKFTKGEYARAEKILYAPLDGIVLTKLKKICGNCDCNIEIPGSMVGLETEEQFFNIQDCLRRHADRIGVPAIWFDDLWVN